ncbi:MAG: peroxiredoxin-like family protein [Myxococcota bacterium]
MPTNKIEAGSLFPEVFVDRVEGPRVDLRETEAPDRWKMVVVYRGKHCPLCTRYLNQLESLKDRLQDLGIDICAVSADSREQLEAHKEVLAVRFPLYFGLGLDQMMTLGLYISHPRSERETDHPFAEPGVFVINADGRVQVVDISNNPFVRPELEKLVSGLEWIKNPDNHYPIRGTYPYA